MHLSRIRIANFRNFSDFDVQLSGNVTVVGENRVGKSNLLYALRLIFDPTLPDSARQLSLSDFWDGLGGGRTPTTRLSSPSRSRDLTTMKIGTCWRSSPIIVWTMILTR